MPSQTTTADVFLGLLAPLWRLVLGGVVLLFVLATASRLAGRGRSRMNTALLVAGTGIVGLVVLGVLASL